MALNLILSWLLGLLAATSPAKPAPALPVEPSRPASPAPSPYRWSVSSPDTSSPLWSRPIVSTAAAVPELSGLTGTVPSGGLRADTPRVPTAIPRRLSMPGQMTAPTPSVAPSAGIGSAPIVPVPSRVPQNHVRARPRAFTPDDPFYFPGPDPGVSGVTSVTTDVLFPGQWHLVNLMPATPTNVLSIHSGVAGAWANDFTGLGITIGIVDDAVQIDHPDLIQNNANVLSLNRRFNADGSVLDNNPNPTDPIDSHGTNVAGLAAARGANGIGVTGSAPFANLVGMNTAGLEIPAIVAAYGHANGTTLGTTIQVKNHSYGPEFPFDPLFLPTVDAIRASALAGTVNVLSIGNDRNNTNADGNKAYPQNSPHAVMIGAVASNGVFANYASYGANLIAVAPSGSQTVGFAGVTTADRTGADGYNTNGTNNFAASAGANTGLSYTNEFKGTSASAPVVSGVVALTLQANPALLAGNAGTGQTTTRAVKHLLVRTSTIVDPNDATPTSDPVGGVGWRTNAGGRTFNQNYGFGLVNATALTQQAPLFSGVTPLTTFSTGTVTVSGGGVPDNVPAGIGRTSSITVPAGDVQPLEEVIVMLNIAHANRGDLVAYVQSPSGYRSRLFDASAETDDNVNWAFTSNAFWGEMPNGNWVVTVADITGNGVTGSWVNYSIDLRMGNLVPVPEPASVLGVVALLGVFARVVRRRPQTAEPALAA